MESMSQDGPVPPFPVTTTSAAEAVTPGRLKFNISTPRMRMHSVQSAEALEELAATGRLLPDPAKAEPYFADAYAWLLRRMDAVLPTTGTGAIWLWARIKRLDLVDLCESSRGQVLLTCDIPKERVLLSHYMDWHAVLNCCPHIPEIVGESDEDFPARLDRAFTISRHVSGQSRCVETDPYSEWPKGLRRDLERGWESILDTRTYGRYESWQATAHYIESSDVVAAVRLK